MHANDSLKEFYEKYFAASAVAIDSSEVLEKLLGEIAKLKKGV